MTEVPDPSAFICVHLRFHFFFCFLATPLAMTGKIRTRSDPHTARAVPDRQKSPASPHDPH